MSLESFLVKLAQQWEVVEHGWMFVIILLALAGWLSIRGLGAFYRERTANQNANIVFLNGRVEGLKAEISNLEKELEKTAAELVPMAILPVIYGSAAVQSLFVQITGGSSVPLKVDPGNSLTWKGDFVTLPRSEIEMTIAAKRLMEAGLAQVQAEHGVNYLTATTTGTSLLATFNYYAKRKPK